MFNDLLNDYMASFEEKIATIQKTLQSGDLQQLYTVVHKITGSSGSYGVMPVYQEALQAEALIREKDAIDGALEQAVNNLVQAMQDQISG